MLWCSQDHRHWGRDTQHLCLPQGKCSGRGARGEEYSQKHSCVLIRKDWPGPAPSGSSRIFNMEKHRGAKCLVILHWKAMVIVGF